MEILKDILKDLKSVLNPNEERCSTFPESQFYINNWLNFASCEEIPKIFHNVSNNDLKNVQPEIIEKLRLWNYKKGLLLSGSTGCGKTHLACLLLKIYFQKNNGWVRFIEANKIIELGEENGIEFLKYKYGECKLLLIDDLGSESCAEWHIKYFFEIINKRYNEDLPTIITSNLSLDDIGKKYSERIKSRLQAKEIKFNNSDLRELL